MSRNGKKEEEKYSRPARFGDKNVAVQIRKVPEDYQERDQVSLGGGSGAFLSGTIFAKTWRSCAGAKPGPVNTSFELGQMTRGSLREKEGITI